MKKLLFLIFTVYLSFVLSADDYNFVVVTKMNIIREDSGDFRIEFMDEEMLATAEMEHFRFLLSYAKTMGAIPKFINIDFDQETCATTYSIFDENEHFILSVRIAENYTSEKFIHINMVENN